MKKPLQITIEYGPEKIVGHIMKINTTGIMVEVDQIPYRVGAVVKATMIFPPHTVPVTEEVRAIKSYDRFFRNATLRKKAEASERAGAEPVQPKKLSEVHFLKLKEETRAQISRYLMDLQVESMKRSK
jgi:hypothetical protein